VEAPVRFVEDVYADGIFDFTDPELVNAAMGFAAYLFFPQRDQLPTPPYAAVNVTSRTVAIGSIHYEVDRLSDSSAEITIIVQALPGATAQGSVSLVTFLPLKAEPVDCANCSRFDDANLWKPPMPFNTTGRATAKVRVIANDFGYTVNGLNASVAIPQLNYIGHGSPGVSVLYDLPGARDYDWSSFPTAFADGDSARWNHQLNASLAPARTAVGINHANQDKDNRNTFLAGALIGLAGGALLAAIQEGLHTGN
jgi:hypothetical protein